MPRPRLTAHAACAALATAACATTGTASQGAEPSCEVENEQRDTVVVESGVALKRGLFAEEVAKIDAAGVISELGFLSQAAAAVFADGRLEVEGLRSDPIGDGSVVIPLLGEYSYSTACSPADAAVGAFALHTIEAREQQQAQHEKQRGRPFATPN
jgi:hypothetical protein